MLINFLEANLDASARKSMTLQFPFYFYSAPLFDPEFSACE